jgi:acetyltransferase-like isoleucine patch superfamily enzyme
MRELLKSIARSAATVVAAPALISFAVRSRILGRNRAFEGSTQALALLPGVTGDYVRRAFLMRTLAHCDQSAVVQSGTIFSQVGARLDANVYVGPACHLGLVHLERDVLLAAGVHVPSGPGTHGTSRLDQPIREQPGSRSLVRIGEGTWVGSAAVILAEVGQHCVIAAGAVVTRRIPDYSVAAGVPARIIRNRRADATTEGQDL